MKWVLYTTHARDRWMLWFYLYVKWKIIKLFSFALHKCSRICENMRQQFAYVFWEDFNSYVVPAFFTTVENFRPNVLICRFFLCWLKMTHIRIRFGQFSLWFYLIPIENILNLNSINSNRYAHFVSIWLSGRASWKESKQN